MSNGSKPPISISDLYRKFVMYYSLSTQCKLQEQRHQTATADNNYNSSNNNNNNGDSDDVDEDAEDGFSPQEDAETNEQQGRSASQPVQLVQPSRRRVRRKGCRLEKQAAAGRTMELELDCLPSDVVIATRNVRNDGCDVSDDVISGPPRFGRRQLRVMTRQTVPEAAESPDKDIVHVKYRYQPPRDHNGLRLPRCPMTSRQQLVTSSSVDGLVDDTVFNGGGLTSTSLDAVGGLRRAAKCRLQVEQESRSSHQPAGVYIYDVGEDVENSPLEVTTTSMTSASPNATTSAAERVIVATSTSFGPSTSSQLPDCGVSSSSFGASCRPVVLCTKKRVNRERASSLDSRLAQSSSSYTGGAYVIANQKLSRSYSDEREMRYNDPMVNSSSSFQQRIGEIILLESQTIRWERIRKTKKLKQQHRESLSTSSVLD